MKPENENSDKLCSYNPNLVTGNPFILSFFNFFILSLLILFPAHQLNAQSDDIFFETLSPELGLSQNTISSIFQDSKGVIWFGTQYGLNRFNGYSIDVFESLAGKETGISHNSINGITEDQHGYLWIATENGLNRYSYNTDEFLRFYKGQDEKGISHNKVSCIYRDKKGRIWAGTEQGIDLVDIEKLTFTKKTFNNFLYNNRIISIHEDSYGNLWIGTLRGLVRYSVDGGLYRIYLNNPSDPASLSHNHVRAVFEDSNKGLWIGTRDGLNLYNPREEGFLHFGSDVYPGLELTNNAVRCITEDSEKNLLIGTNEGLNILNLVNRSLNKYNQKKKERGSLNHFYIYSLFIDNAGTVWVGTFGGGVNFYNIFTKEFRFFNPGNNFVYGHIGSLVEYKNELWIGTGGGRSFELRSAVEL